MSDLNQALIDSEGGCVGKRRTNACLITSFLLLIPAGVIVILVAPRVCPNGYDEKSCYAINTGKTYPCNNEQENECANKIPNDAGLGAGIALIAFGVVATIVLMIVRCCRSEPPCCC